MNEEIILNYILRLVQYNKTMHECINLGFSPNKLTKTEILMLEESEKYILKLMKKRKIKLW